MHPSLIVAWLAERYGASFSSATCQLFRSYTNDVYLIERAGQRFVLKLYALGWRTLADVQWEIDLLQHLSAQGVPIAQPIAAQDQQPIQSITTQAGQQVAVLCAYAAGDKPQPPFTTLLYERFGQAIARMHTATDSFVTTHPRRALDTNALIDEPIQLAAPLLPDSNQRAWLLDLAAIVKNSILADAAAGLDWGVIHGDATLDNLHVTENGAIVLYDFDSSSFGWRAADLQGWAANHAEYMPYWEAFHRGYAHVRAPKAIDRAAAPYLTIAWDIWGLKIDLERRILALGQERVEEYLASQLELLSARSRQYGIAMENEKRT